MTLATFVFTPEGTIRGLYTEAIDLTCLGRLHVQRATTIKFDNSKQAWRVKDRQGFALFTSPSRRDCLEWERRYLDQQEEMKHGGSRT
jgi:hypothetical protein